MAMILKMGTGGDDQAHVSTPINLKDPYAKHLS